MIKSKFYSLFKLFKMVQKKETALIKVEGGLNTHETTELMSATPQPENVAEMQSRIEELQKRLASIPQNLEDRITYFNESCQRPQ